MSSIELKSRAKINLSIDVLGKREDGYHLVEMIMQTIDLYDIIKIKEIEIDEINIILGEDLSSEQVADQNYLAQLRLYNNLIKKGMTPDESKSDSKIFYQSFSECYDSDGNWIGDGKNPENEVKKKVGWKLYLDTAVGSTPNLTPQMTSDGLHLTSADGSQYFKKA